MAIMIAKLTTKKIKSTFNLNYILALNTTFTMLQNNIGDMVSLHIHLNFCDKLGHVLGSSNHLTSRNDHLDNSHQLIQFLHSSSLL